MRSLAAFSMVFVALASCGGGDDATDPGGTAGATSISAGGAGGSGTSGAAGAGAKSGASGVSGNGGVGGSGASSGAGTGGTSAAGASGASGASGGGAGGAGGGGAGASGAAGKAGASGAGAGGGGAGKAGSGGAAGAGGSGGGAAGGPLAICQGVATATFMPPTVCDGPSGNTSKQVPSNHVYSTSWFGCYAKPDGTIVKDPTDNCLFACGSKGLCAAGLSGPECEASIKWFAADADRYGCGARIRLTNCVNGKQVVVTTLDRGPNCPTEKSFGVPVIDMSHDAMIYLFDGKEYGGSDKKRIVVEPVDAATPLGPV
jgi:hypothetical protein